MNLKFSSCIARKKGNLIIRDTNILLSCVLSFILHFNPPLKSTTFYFFHISRFLLFSFFLVLYSMIEFAFTFSFCGCSLHYVTNFRWPNSINIVAVAAAAMRVVAPRVDHIRTIPIVMLLELNLRRCCTVHWLFGGRFWLLNIGKRKQ